MPGLAGVGPPRLGEAGGVADEGNGFSGLGAVGLPRLGEVGVSPKNINFMSTPTSRFKPVSIGWIIFTSISSAKDLAVC